MAREVVNNTDDDANGIGIGHSMGGVVLREINENTAPNHIGGIITAGSPLNGSRIVNAWRRGDVEAYIDNAVSELLKGPRREYFTGYIIVNTSFRIFDGRELAEVLYELAMDELPIELMDGQSANDLREGSPYMNDAREYNINIPRISIYGNENSPVHYRLASSSMGRPDSYLPRVIRDARNVYNFHYLNNVALFYSPVDLWQAAGWKAGRDYLDDKSEKGWNNLIGATRTESRRSCYQEFVCPDYSCYNNIETYEDYLECQEICYRERCRTYTRSYNQPSDGLLHESTQIGERTHATTSRWNPNATFEARGANHNEYDTHAGTRERLETIFDGNNSDVPLFFETLRR